MTEPVVVVVRSSGDDGYRLAGSRPGVPGGNSFLAHLESRAFAAASVRAYAYDLANFARFLTERGVSLAAVVPTDLFDWVDWQCVRRPAAAATVVPIAAGRGSAPASVNRRGRRRPRVLRVPGAVRRPGRQSGADAASRVGATAEGTRPAWAPWPGPAPARWPTSSSAAAAAGVVGSGRGVGVPRRSGHAPGPGDCAADGARRAAGGGGAVAAVGRRGPGQAAGSDRRQGRPGAHRPGGRGVLRRARRLSAHGAPGRPVDHRMLRRIARADRGASPDRGGAAQRVPLPPPDLRSAAGAAAPAAAHLR